MEPAWVCLMSANNFGGKSRKMGGMEEEHMIGPLISQYSDTLVEGRKGWITETQLLGNHKFHALLWSPLLS